MKQRESVLIDGRCSLRERECFNLSFVRRLILYDLNALKLLMLNNTS